ncbi:MAG: hypothetical protein L3K13_03900 [Thermoplasmata archaeon]|nr:hypothetical protein [Thermoplasmata archaeon]
MAPPPSIWTRINTDGGPTTNLSSFSVAYDAADGYDVMFGGLDEQTATPVNTTWKFAGGVWSVLSPLNSPPALSQASLAYDPAIGAVVMFGGALSYGSSSDTWLFKGGNWTQLSLGASPAPRAGASLVYDAADGYLVLFGGSDVYSFPYKNFSDTWEFTANKTWKQLHPANSPPACTASAATYDPVARAVYDFSGYYVNQTTYLTDCTATTWSYAGGVWTNLTTVGGPIARSAAAFVFDPALNASILYGGMNYSAGGNQLKDLWELSGGAWTELSTTTLPAAQASSTLTYDPASGFLVLTEGIEPYYGFGVTIHANVWLFDAFSLGSVSGPAGSAILEAGTTVLFHVATPSGSAKLLYIWTGIAGCTPSTTARWSCALPTAGNYTVGANATNQYDLVRAATPLNLSVLPTLATPLLSIAPTSVDPNESTVFSLVGHGGAPPYSYAWSGLPFGCSSASTANLTCTPSVPGTYSTIVGTVTDSIGVHRSSAAGTLSVFGSVGLSPVVVHPGLVDVGRSTTLSVGAHGGSGGYQYVWSGLPPGCATSDSAAFPCTPSSSGSFPLSVAVTDTLGGHAVGTATLNVAAFPTVNLTLSPAVLDAGEQMTLSASTTGGVGNFTFAFTGLPFGCTSGTHPVVQCAPSVEGPYVMQVSATDSEGLTVQSAPLGITIAAALGVGVVVTPAPASLGGEVTISLRSSGGSGPYSYSYSGLPPGCLSQNLSALTCTPTRAGNYTVHAYVTDASGVQRSTIFYLVVHAPAKNTAATTWLFVGLGVAVTAVLLVVLLLLRPRWRGRDEEWVEAPDEMPLEGTGPDGPAT